MSFLIRLVFRACFLPIWILLRIWDVRLPRPGLPRYYRTRLARGPYRWR